MNIFIQEFKWNLKPTLIWALSLSCAGIFFICLYPSFTGDMEAVNKLMEQYPPEILKALGLGPDGLGSFQGFYSFVLVYVILCSSIQGLVTGIQVIGKESARKTCDFLFTKPVSRIRILANKYLAVVLCMIISGFIYFGVSFLFANRYGGDYNHNIFYLLSSSVILTGLLFTALGFCIGCFLKKAKAPVFVGIGVGALCFGLQMLANMFDERALDFISPMSYVSPSYITLNQEYDYPLLICLIAAVILLTLLGFWRYRTKDIHSA